jgi:YceI-like domain
MNLNRKLLLLLGALTVAFSGVRDCRAQAQDSQWALEQSTLTYHVSHPLHQVDGVSHAARGKGACHAGQCDFLIAAPVKSFDSGDSNRDLHMRQVTKAGQFPLVTVRTRLPASLEGAATINADLDVEFAGQTVQYKQVAFQQVTHGDEVRITGTIPAKVSDFKIDPPSLFTVAIKNDIPVRVEMTWQREK